MKTMNKNEKGITLIALVITIIVLLLLAGVAISMLTGENGVLNRATSAEKESSQAEEEESVRLAVQSALATGNGEITSDEAYEMLNDELAKAGYEGEEITSLPEVVNMNYKNYKIDKYGDITECILIAKLKESGEPVKSKTTSIDDEGAIITIPEGFKIAEDSATLVKDGIVVVAPDKSEFVWVPVTDITKMAKTAKEGGTDTKGRTNYQGILYNFKSEDGVYSATEMEDYGQGTTSYREPSLVTGNSADTFAILESVTGTSYDASSDYYKTILGYDDSVKDFGKAMQEDFNEMVESVDKNKGFYVGRYETSLDDSENKNAQSIANKESASAASTSANTWYGLYQKQKEYSTKEYETGKTLENIVGSSMIWGSQYDQMMIWMQENGIDVTSTDSDKLKGAKKNESSTTGTENKDVLNNVYDIIGCHLEWTLEAYHTCSRTYRWGNIDGTYPPGHRSNLSTYVTYSNYGSRLTLYVK